MATFLLVINVVDSVGLADHADVGSDVDRLAADLGGSVVVAVGFADVDLDFVDLDWIVAADYVSLDLTS